MTWAFTDDHANENEALQAIGGAAAWYYTCGDCYCRRKEPERRTSGARLDFIPATAAYTLFPDAKAKAHVKALVGNGLWLEAEGGFVVAGYMRKYYGASAAAVAPAEPVARPTPSQLGGQARASQASRGPGGTFQPKSSQLAPAAIQPAGPAAPATRASESGSDSGEKEEEKPSSKDLTSSARIRLERPTSLESACAIPIRERCELLGTDAHLASYIQPERWPELLRLRELFAEVSGLSNVELGPYAHHKGTQRLVAMFACGHSLETLERAFRQLPKDKWWVDNARKFGIAGLSLNIVDSMLAKAQETALSPEQVRRIARAKQGLAPDPRRAGGAGPSLIATMLPPMPAASGGDS
jgi:hypothetical protein